MGLEIYVVSDDRLAPASVCGSLSDDEEPGSNRTFLKGLLLCLPVASVIWAGIIYGASRLAR